MKGLCENCCEQGADTTCYNYDGKGMIVNLCQDCYDARELTRDEE